MINYQILKRAMRSNFILWLVLMLVAVSFLDIMIIVPSFNVNHENAANITMIMEAGFFNQTGYLVLLLFVIITSHKLVCSEVQNGYITYVIASPVSRQKIITSKIMFMILSLIAGFVLIWLTTAPAIMVYEDKIDISLGAYSLVLFGNFILLFAVSGISFLASAYFNKSLWSFTIGAGVPVLFYILKTLSLLSDSLDGLKYLSINTLFNPNVILEQHPIPVSDETTGEFVSNRYVAGSTTLSDLSKWIGQLISLFVVGTCLYVTSDLLFCKRDLPL